MEQLKINLVGKKLSRLELRKQTLQDSTFGQSFFPKLILLCFSLVLITTSILMCGWWGGLLGLNLIIPGDDYRAWFYIVPTVIATIIWMFYLTTQEFQSSLIPTLITAVATIGIFYIFEQILVPRENIGTSINVFEYTIFIIASLMLTIFNYFTLFTSFNLIHFVFGISFKTPKSKITVVSMFALVTGLCACWFLAGGHMDNDTAEILRKQASLPDALPYFTFNGGLLFGGLITYVSIASKPNDALFDLTSALGTWRGTSFYKMDLSHLNFSNSCFVNCDFRARSFYRTCLQGARGLDRARVDNQYFDLKNMKVQYLLVHGIVKDFDFKQLNLRGAYLQNTDLCRVDFREADLSGADCRHADLRGAIFINSQVKDVDFSYANLTGICIKGWVVDSQTCFSNVQCDYVFRDIDVKGEFIEPFPLGRNFKDGEFESLYQDISNVAELILEEGDDWQSALFSLKKLQIEDEGLGLELKGIEKRGGFWVVKITHDSVISKQEAERILNRECMAMREKIESQEQDLHEFLGIVKRQSKTLDSQANSLENLSQKSFSNYFTIIDSTITNLSGSGHIEYNEVVNKVQEIVHTDSSSNANQVAQNFIEKLQIDNIATTTNEQIELIQHILLKEAQSNDNFRQFLIRQSEKAICQVTEEAIRKALEKVMDKIT